MTPVILFVLAAIFFAFYRVSKPSTDADITSWTRLVSFLAAIIFLSAAIVYFAYWLAWAWQDVRSKANEAAALAGWRGDVTALTRLSDSLAGLPYNLKYDVIDRFLTSAESDSSMLPCGVPLGWAKRYIEKCALEAGREGWANGAPLIPQHRYPDGAERAKVQALHRWLIGLGYVTPNTGNNPPTVLDIGGIMEALS